ncbi:MAG: hypothetical protein IID33_15995, partial [Planctomycetes bacterium]|nr:hypothetical protein [Planctomycetota bacterium]
ATLLFTSSADTAWSNFAIQPLFLPIVLRFATLDPSGEDQVVEHVAGDDIHIKPGERLAEEIEITTPPDAAGRSSTLIIGTDAEHVALFPGAFATGIYRWRPVGTSSDASRERPNADALFAVNGDGGESALVHMDWETWKASSEVELTVGTNYQELRRQLAAADRGIPIWDWFLLIVLVAVTCEAMLANRYKPESIGGPDTIAGRTQPQRPAS